jgi:uncharacterized protein (DUF4213/DUF364 family)
MIVKPDILKATLTCLKDLYRRDKLTPGEFLRAGIKGGWNAVIGARGQCGMAFNFSGDELAFGRPVLDTAKIQSCIGQSLFNLAFVCIASPSWQERAIGIAALSALSQPLLTPQSLRGRDFIIEDGSKDFASLLQPDDIAAVVGYGGGVSRLLGKCREIHVTDMRSRESFQTLLIDREIKWCPDNVFIHSEKENQKVLSKATIVSITGSSLVNGTFEELLGYSRNARLIVMYGASVGFIPDILFERGVDFIHSYRIIDPKGFEEGLIKELNMERVLQTTQQMQAIRKKAA